MGDSHANWTTMFFQIMFLICSVCNTYGVASAASPSCASDEYRAGQLCCLACPGGYRVHRDCTATLITLCSKCPDGTFKEDLSGQKQCSACTQCVTGQEVKKFCTPTSDTECETWDGFFCSDSADKDTFSEATLSCQPHTICDSVGGVQIQPGTDSTDSTCIKYVAIAFIIIGCICFIISLVLGALFYRWLKMERDLTEWEKQINEMETPEQVEECYALWDQLEEKKKTQKQERKFDELDHRHYEKKESLELDWNLTEYANRINEMETPDQLVACDALWDRLDKKKKTPKQERKFDELFDRHDKKVQTLDLDLEFIERVYRRRLEETQGANRRLNELIDDLLEKEKMTNTDNNHEKANLIREKQKKKRKLDRELTELIDQLLEETREHERKIAVPTDCPEPTRDQQEHTIPTIPDETMDDQHDDQSPAPPSSSTHNGSVSVSVHQEDHQPVHIKRDNGASRSTPLSLMRSSTSQSAGERVSLLIDNIVAEAEVTPVLENRYQPGSESDD